jgi:hypothetical protein
MMTILKRCSAVRLWCQLCTALAIIALLGASHVALAQQEVDRKVYPGTFCQPGLGLSGAQPSFVQYDDRGAIRNLSTTERLQVLCPVVRDETMGTAGLLRATVRIFAGRSPGTSEIDDNTFVCHLTGRTPFGAIVDSSFQNNIGMPTGNRTLFFENPTTSSDTNAPGAYLFECLLPPRLETGGPASGIISYRVEEIITSNPHAESSLDEMDAE